jgi:hypothetical protein
MLTFFTSSVYASALVFKLGVASHSYQEGWKGHNKSKEYFESLSNKDTAFNVIVDSYQSTGFSSLSIGVGVDYLINVGRLNGRYNRFEVSIMKLNFQYHGLNIVGGLGWSRFNEKEIAYGPTFSLELVLPKISNHRLSIKYSNTNTDYEPRGQSGDLALRGGSTKNLSMLLSF